MNSGKSGADSKAEGISETAPLLLLVESVENQTESTLERLGSAIRLGVFAVGTQLPAERELAQQMGVSRSKLREAIL